MEAYIKLVVNNGSGYNHARSHNAIEKIIRKGFYLARLGCESTQL